MIITVIDRLHEIGGPRNLLFRDLSNQSIPVLPRARIGRLGTIATWRGYIPSSGPGYASSISETTGMPTQALYAIYIDPVREAVVTEI